jgi:hypothetical protein
MGHREAGQRLGDKNYVASLRKRADDDVRIFCKTGSAVVARQIDCDRFVPRRANTPEAADVGSRKQMRACAYGDLVPSTRLTGAHNLI